MTQDRIGIQLTVAVSETVVYYARKMYHSYLTMLLLIFTLFGNGRFGKSVVNQQDNWKTYLSQGSNQTPNLRASRLRA